MNIKNLKGFEFIEGDVKCHLAYGIAETLNETMEVHLAVEFDENKAIAGGSGITPFRFFAPDICNPQVSICLNQVPAALKITDTLSIEDHNGTNAVKTAVHISNQSSGSPNYNIVDGDVFVFSFIFKLR